MKKLICLFVMAMLVSGCVATSPYKEQLTILDQSYKEKKISTIDYLTLRQQLVSQDAQWHEQHNLGRALMMGGTGLQGNQPAYQDNTQQVLMQQQQQMQEQQAQYYKQATTLQPTTQPTTQTHTTCRWVNGQYILTHLSSNENLDFYTKVTESQNIYDLYEFIYGNKRHEFPILKRGLNRLYEEAKDNNEREKAFSLIIVTMSAYINSVKENMERFKHRTGRDLYEVLQKAKNGDDECLLELVEFDKTFLFESVTKNRILKAEAEEDDLFLHNLGEALKRKTGKIDVIPGHKDERQKRLRKLLRCLRIAHLDFNKKENIKLLEDMLVNIGDGSYTDFPEPISINQIERTLKRMELMEAK